MRIPPRLCRSMPNKRIVARLNLRLRPRASLAENETVLAHRLGLRLRGGATRTLQAETKVLIYPPFDREQQ